MRSRLVTLRLRSGPFGAAGVTFDNRARARQQGLRIGVPDQRSGSGPVLADTGERSHRGEVHSMKKKLFVRVAAVATSLAGLLLAGGAGFGVR